MAVPQMSPNLGKRVIPTLPGAFERPQDSIERAVQAAAIESLERQQFETNELHKRLYASIQALKKSIGMVGVEAPFPSFEGTRALFASTVGDGRMELVITPVESPRRFSPLLVADSLETKKTTVEESLPGQVPEFSDRKRTRIGASERDPKLDPRALLLSVTKKYRSMRGSPGKRADFSRGSAKMLHKLDQILEQAPFNADALAWKARLLSHSADPEKGQEISKLLERALRKNPDHALALQLQGAGFLSEGRYEDAVAVLTKALDIMRPDDSDRPAALRDRGKALLDLDRLDLAEKDFEEAARKDRFNVLSLHGLAIVRMKKHNFEGASKNLKKALDLDPDNAVLLARQAVVRDRLGQHFDASVSFDQAIIQDRLNVYALRKRGAYYLSRYLEGSWRDGLLQNACVDLNRALREDPKSAYILSRLSVTLFLMGRTEDAREAMQAAIRVSRPSPFIQRWQGQIFEKEGSPLPNQNFFQSEEDSRFII